MCGAIFVPASLISITIEILKLAASVGSEKYKL
jgi:hypothetical protein